MFEIIFYEAEIVLKEIRKVYSTISILPIYKLKYFYYILKIISFLYDVNVSNNNNNILINVTFNYY